MILHVFGDSISVNVYDLKDKLAILADARTIQMLVDAHDIQEPLKMNGNPCRISFLDEQQLDGLDDGPEVHLLEVVLEPLH